MLWTEITAQLKLQQTVKKCCFELSESYKRSKALMLNLKKVLDNDVIYDVLKGTCHYFLNSVVKTLGLKSSLNCMQ